MVFGRALEKMTPDAWQTVYHNHMHVLGGEQLDVPVYRYPWARLSGRCPSEP